MYLRVNCFFFLAVLCLSDGAIFAKGLHPPALPAHAPLNGKPYVQGSIYQQLGNQMFEVAATISLALDNGAEAVFPDLTEVQDWDTYANYRYVFWRLNPAKPATEPEFSYSYTDPGTYSPIPYKPNMKLFGHFQSEKYFKHHKQEILDLFAPHENIVNYINRRHPWFAKARNAAVAVHIRCYGAIYGGGHAVGGILPFVGMQYFRKAMARFPANTPFLIFSENIPWCKKQLAGFDRRMVFIEGQPHYVDMYMMSLCKHNIISNSSFSWWSAYLNKNPGKIVIAPKTWFVPGCGLEARDIIPEGWVVLE